MKIRAGFVSNSSSSSFVAFGYKVDKKKYSDFRDFIVKMVGQKKLEAYCLKTLNKSFDSMDEDDQEDAVMEFVYDCRSSDKIFILDSDDIDCLQDKWYFVGVKLGEIDCDSWDEEQAFTVSDLDKKLTKMVPEQVVGTQKPVIVLGTREC